MDTNSLAELAVTLGTDALSLGEQKYPEIVKAQRIISVLAKSPINDIRAVANLPKDGRKAYSSIDYVVWKAVDIIENCRAIAEEGANNGK